MVLPQWITNRPSMATILSICLATQAVAAELDKTIVPDRELVPILKSSSEGFRNRSTRKPVIYDLRAQTVLPDIKTSQGRVLLRNVISRDESNKEVYERSRDYESSIQALNRTQIEAVTLTTAEALLDVLAYDEVDYRNLGINILSYSVEIVSAQQKCFYRLDKLIDAQSDALLKQIEMVEQVESHLVSRSLAKGLTFGEVNKPFGKIKELFTVSRPPAKTHQNGDFTEFRAFRCNHPLHNVCAIVDVHCTDELVSGDFDSREFTEMMNDIRPSSNAQLDAWKTALGFASPLQKRAKFLQAYSKATKRHVYYLGDISKNDSFEIPLLPCGELVGTALFFKVSFFSDECVAQQVFEFQRNTIENAIAEFLSRDERESRANAEEVQIKRLRAKRAVDMRVKNQRRFESAMSSVASQVASQQEKNNRMSAGWRGLSVP
ncbi:hypothetical protein Poly24_22700 [Rosistilla carotiformis]|uniref:Uncharacterized protein n=1 Tax=Rosistilla carotiformis TaxID=2528017 RepID=A0A518JSP4_9BACT|nr:hypothetical protein [Rosistilla carotiformis]QDV68560.1 hypothetical protein Poly24_22700 [Rosistilla carotiformis]